MNCLFIHGLSYIISVMTSFRISYTSGNIREWALTKSDWNGNIKRYKARLVTKGHIKKYGIDYKETFSLVSKKDSPRIIIVLLAQYDLELHQMDVKTTFLNGDMEKDIYMNQPEGFFIERKSYMVCKRKKSIYGLKTSFPKMVHQV